MKKKDAVLFCIFLTMYTSVLAGIISGRLIDRSTKKSLEFVQVSVSTASDNKLVKGMITGANGEYSINDLPQGKYLLKTRFIGYSPIEIPIQIDSKHLDINLGNIEMTPVSHNLKEFEVTGQKSQVRFEIDRKVYNIEQNLTTAGSSASEILRNIPSVEIAADGNLLLRNNKNVIVWINGRPSGLNDDNRTQVLEQLPAETIDRIEVITNPSSKYSPEGSAGIINIVLKKVTQRGTSGSVSAGVDTNGGRNATVNFYYSTPKWNVNTNAGYRNDVRNMVFNSDRWTYNPGIDTVVRYSRDKVRIDGDGFFARTNAIWHASGKDQLTINGMITTSHRYVTERIGNQRFKGKNESMDYRYTDSPNDRNLYTIALDYTHVFDKKGHEIHTYVEQNWINAQAYTEIHQMDSLFNSLYFQWKDSEAKRNETTLQIDYTYPISKESKLELGYKGEFLTRETNELSYTGLTRNTGVNQHELDNFFEGSDNRNSLYVNYSGKIKKLTYQTGLRGEYNRLRNRSIIYDKTGSAIPIDFGHNYPGIYPSLFLDYQLPTDNTLQFNYTRRINRPKGRMNNPFRNVADSANIEFGNPDLKPEYSNAFELSHLKTWPEHTLSTMLYYRTTNNVIQTVNYVATVGKYDIKYITSMNITNAQAAGMEIMLKDRFFKTLDLTSTFNLYYNHLDAFEYVGNQYAATHSMGWSGRVIANVTFPDGFAGQISGGYQSRRNIAQGESLPVWGMDAGIRKTLLNRHLMINITVRDILNTRMYRDVTSGYNFCDYSEYKTNARSIGLVITYNFGNQSKKQDKTKSSDNPLNGDF